MKKIIGLFIAGMLLASMAEARTFYLKTINGKSVQITERYGEYFLEGDYASSDEVLLEFFGTRCGPCQAKAPSLTNKNRDPNVQVIGFEVMHSSNSAIIDFAVKNNVEYPIVNSFGSEMEDFLAFLSEKGFYKGFVPFGVKIVGGVLTN